MEEIGTVLNKLFVETDSENVQQIEEIRKSFEKLEVAVIPSITSSKFIPHLLEIYNNIFDKLSIAETDDDGEFKFSPEILCIKEYYKEHLRILLDLNKFLVFNKILSSNNGNYEFTKNIVVKCIIIYTQFSSEQIYANLEVLDLAKDGLKYLLSVSNCSSMDELMFGSLNRTVENREYEDTDNMNRIVCGVMQKILRELLDLYNRDTFKRRRSYENSCFWLLHNTKGEMMETFGGHIVNFFLLMLDGDEIIHKIQALTGFNIIIDRLMTNEFYLYDRNFVIYNAIILQVDCKDPEVLKQIYICLIKWAKYLDDAKLDEDTYCDEVIEKLLSRLYFEQGVINREICIDALKFAIEMFSISAVSNWNSIKNVITEYLNTYDGPKAMARLITLDVIMVSLKEFWPIIDDDDMVELIKPVSQFYLSICSDHQISIEVKTIAAEKCKTIYRLLNSKEIVALELKLSKYSDEHSCLKPLLELLHIV